MVCTIYSHQLGFDKVQEIVQRIYPKGKITVSTQDDFDIIEVEIKGGLFSSTKKIKISYRQRAIPSYQIPEVDDSPLTANLKGLYGFVDSLPTTNDTVKSLFLQKILTLNSEFSILQEQGETSELKSLIQQLAKEFDAILFVQPNTIISQARGQHFLDNSLALIIDTEGNCGIDHLNVQINSVYFEKQQIELLDDQLIRKAQTEKVLVSKSIKINKNLPCIESELQVVIRKPKEIAQRVSILAVTNLVAFNSISAEDAIDYLKKYNLWNFVTPNEKEFLADPTDDKKNHETWKCEGIWTLMWALNKVEALGFPNELCNLSTIPAEEYPVDENKDPNTFIDSIVSIRSIKDILDANDLYYRLEWACVDARINGRQIQEVHPSVVYERHYALNWLIHYMDQDWDDVSCDS